MLSEVIRRTHKLRKVLAKVRLNTTLRLHEGVKKRIKWYAKWHGFRYSKALHIFLFIIMCLGVLSSLFPTQTKAALVTRTITKTSLADFAEGALSDLLNENDSLSMHLGKKVNTGNTSTSADLNSYSGRSITRTSDGKIHIVWLKKESAPKQIYHTVSADEGSSWEIPTQVATDQSATGVLLKVDGNNQIHLFWALTNPGGNQIKHKIRGTDGNWGSTILVPTNDLDGAVADWQAIPQGDHYGNYYDTVTGGLATVTRTTPKTIYDATTGKIHDVPAGYLGVRPYSNSQAGGLGYEAMIEEARTNYLVNSDSDQAAAIYGMYGTSGTPTKSLVTSEAIRSNVMRYQYTGVAGDVGVQGVAFVQSAVGTFAAGESATASIYMKGTTVGITSVTIANQARDSAGVLLGSSSQVATLSSTAYTRITIPYATLPASTSFIRLGIYFNGIDNLDTIDIYAGAPQIEKGAFATSFISTGASANTRNADLVSIPTTNWSKDGGSVLNVATRGTTAQYAMLYHLPPVGTGSTNSMSCYQVSNSVSSPAWGANNIGIDTAATGLPGVGTPFVAGGFWSGAEYGSVIGGVRGASVIDDNWSAISSIAYIGGRTGSTNYWNGPISRVASYPRALTNEEITQKNTMISGTEEALLRNPAADWQATFQGDHYGNFQNSVGGGLATVTRTGPKTIYDPAARKIYDVPANYLGVRPRSDGKPGLEAEIEESRNNYLLRSQFDLDTNSDGLSDVWADWGSRTGTPTYSISTDAPYGKSQRVQYTGMATDSAGKSIMLVERSGGFVAGDSVTASFYIKGSCVGCVVSVCIDAYDSSYTYLGGWPTLASISSTWARYSATKTGLPASTAYVSASVLVTNIHEGDVVDFMASAAQLEKGANATSYIPTAAAVVLRNADVVTVPTTGWNSYSGTIMATYLKQTERADGIRIGIMGYEANTPAGTIMNMYHHTDCYALTSPLNATNIFDIRTCSPGYRTQSARWQVGQPVRVFIDGTSGTRSDIYASPMGTASSIATLGHSAAFPYHEYLNGPIQRLTVFAPAISDANIAKVSSNLSNNGSTFDLPVPSIDLNSNIQLVYNKGGVGGIGYRAWNGSSWSTPLASAVVSGIGDQSHQNTLSIGSNLYYFYTLDSDGKRYYVRRVNGTWFSPTLLSDFTSHDSNEIVDSEGDIYIFATDESLTDTIIKYRKYTVASNSFSLWTTLESESTKDVASASATVVSNGNVWVYYNIASDIYYKVFNKASGTWGSRTSFNVENPSPWENLAGAANNGVLNYFNQTATSGWVGTGATDDQYSLAFDKVDDYVNAGKGQIQNGDWWTAEAWVKMRATSGLRQTIMNNYYGSNGFGIEPSSRIIFWPRIDNANAFSGYGTTQLQAGTWYHIAMSVGDGGKVKGYINGVQEYLSGDIGAGQTSNLPNDNLTIGKGSHSATEYFGGQISNVRLYNRALTQTEIQSNYSVGNYASAGYETNGLVQDLNAAAADGTNPPSGGPTLYPKVRYQENFHYFPDKVDLLYRQNSTGDTASYNLYYGTVGSDSTGVYTSPESGNNVLSTNWLGGWGDPALSSNVNIPSGTKITYDMRTGNGSSKDAITWDDWVLAGSVDSSTGTGNRLYTIAAASMPGQDVLPTGESKYLQVKITLISENGSNVPTLFDYSLNYLADENPPAWTYPASVPAYTDVSKTTVIPHNTWGDLNSFTSIYFDWAGASEPSEESGISNYYVYFGTDNTADPITAGVNKGALTEGLVTIATPQSGSTYYLRVTVRDLAGNTLHMPSGTSVFAYKFDNTRPQPPTNFTVDPIGWSTQNNFTITWQAAIDPGAGASGIKGYEYKRAGGGDNWTYVAAASTITVSNLVSYQDGMNDFYIRSIDNAGNNSGDTTQDWTVVHYYYNGLAPSKPTALTVDPQSAYDNEFTFEWDEPANHNSPIKGYYYSVNSLPQLSNSAFTTAKTTGIIPAATQQGFNDFYVVAIDESDNISWSSYETIKFECNTSAPGIPGGITISDSSNMATNDWALTLKWLVPGTGIVHHYNIYRSTNGINFAKISQTASTGYLDTGLSNTSTYHYKVTAVDNAASEGADSSVVSKQPTGKFTEPPIIVTGPEVDAKATNATIIWSTNRSSSSFVAYGRDENNLENKGQLDSVTSHSVNISGLEAGALYYYKVQSFDENRDYPTEDALSNTYTFRTQSAPAIEDVSVEDISLSSAIISWKTTSSATSRIIYGKNSDFSQSVEDKSGSAVTIHTVRLEGLDHSSTYNYKILGTDVDENKLESDNYTFNTLIFPRVMNVRFEQQKNTATSTLKVTWGSNVPLTSIVEFKEAQASSFREISASKLTEEHSLLVPNLKDNTDYVMVIKGRDAHGNQAVSDPNNVRTDYDTRPPGISDITTETSIVGFGVDARGQVVVSWLTDEPSTSQVEYGPGATGTDYSSRTQEDTSLTTSHVVIISDLKTSSPYHFRVISKDNAKNEAVSDSNSVLTDQANESVIDLIIKSLQSTIGWIFNVFNR